MKTILIEDSENKTETHRMNRRLTSIGVAIAVAFVSAGSSFAQDLALLAGSEIKGTTV